MVYAFTTLFIERNEKVLYGIFALLQKSAGVPGTTEKTRYRNL